jgi:hypothetical protein
VLTIAGGALSDPADQIGGIFKSIGFFSDYPYALPTFFTGTFGASATLLCGLFLKEVCGGIAHTPRNADLLHLQTLERKAKGDQSPAEAPMSTMELIKAPGVAMVLFLYAHVMLLGLAYTAGKSSLIAYSITPNNQTDSKFQCRQYSGFPTSHSAAMASLQGKYRSSSWESALVKPSGYSSLSQSYNTDTEPATCYEVVSTCGQYFSFPRLSATSF